MRIASLVPSATEILFALGLGEQVVAVTHECDFPAPARELPHLTRTVIAPGLDAGEIDAEVKRITAEGQALYELDVDLLEGLQVDLIVTQEVCRVCAVSYEDVLSIADRLPTRPAVLSLDPSTLDEVLGDVRRTAEAAQVPERGIKLEAELRRRLDAVREQVDGTEPTPVVALEWLDPPFSAGHWLPEMVAIAGGRELIGQPGGRSTEITWPAIAAARPEQVVVIPCGWDLARADQEAATHRPSLEALGARKVHVVDAAASFSRPGPRLIDGTELLAHLLHPDHCPDPGTIPHAAPDWAFI